MSKQKRAGTVKACIDMKRHPGAMHFKVGCTISSQTGWNRGSLCTRPRTLCPGTGAYFNWRDVTCHGKNSKLSKTKRICLPGI